MLLVPAIDILGGQVVRLTQGDYERVTVYNDDALAQARTFCEAGAKRIHVVDLDGARTGVPENIDLIERMVSELDAEVEVGGGVRSMETIERYAAVGVRRIVLGSALVKDRLFALDAAEAYGDMIVAGIDARAGVVATEGWLDTAQSISANDLIADLEDMGITNLVYTDISRDGTQAGIDAQVYANIANAHPSVKVTASGGIGSLEDLRALRESGAPIEAAITGRAIYEGTFSIEEGLEVCEGAISMCAGADHIGACNVDGVDIDRADVSGADANNANSGGTLSC